MAGRRRRKGTGSIEKQRDGTYIARTANRERSGRFARRSDAEAALDEWNRQVAGGIDIAASRQPVRRFLAEWLDVVREKVKPSTHAYYDRHAGYAMPYIGDLALESVTPLHIERMLTELGKTSLSERSVHHVRAVLRAACNAAVRWRLIERNPVAGTQAPQVADYPARVLTIDEQAALLTAADGHRLAALYHLALGLGLRRGELLGLRWSDIDSDARTLSIRESKTASGRRMLPLTDNLVATLDAHRVNQDEERIIAQQRASDAGQPIPAWNAADLVFCSDAGTLLSPRNLVRSFKALLHRAGLSDRIRLHDLRHTAITFFVASGGDPKSAQAFAGHADATTTMRIYAHLQADKLRDGVEAAERARGKKRA
jgi:integrase